MIEGAGGDFSANQLGKWKMVLQCGAVISILCALIQPNTLLLDNISLAFLWGDRTDCLFRHRLFKSRSKNHEQH